MRIASATVAATVAAAGLFSSSGCSTGGPPSTGTSSAVAGPRPHGGLLFALPGDKGYGELVVEYEKAATKAKGSVRSQVVVYFLQPDGRSPLAVPPTEVTARLDLPDGEPQTLPLKSQPNSRDPVGAGRFASEPGKFDYDELRIELTATVDGQPFVTSLALR